MSRALGVAHDEQRRRRSSRAEPWCEALEHRRLFSADATTTSLSQITAQTSFDVISAVSTGPTGLTPEEIRTAYGIDLISFSGGTVSGTGAGETIAIVDAFNDPDIASDLATFDQEYDLPAPPSFTVDNLGATTTDARWALETALDVEWAHAIAPEANIILVEAASSSLSNLFSAVAFAGKQAGVNVVSMSWGSSEFRGESSYDSIFTTAAGHVGVTYVAASGDTGASGGPEYPSVSPNVLAVGGTTLTATSSGSYLSESAWSDSTGGFSGTDSDFRWYESEPSYQTATLESVGLSDGVRTTPDVSFDANPSSGVSVYDSVDYDGQSGWFQVGGTSLAAPAWAGLIAIVDQGLATGGKSSLTTTEVLTDLYWLPSSDFNDITTGSNGYSATAGYDLVTGLGTPRANLLVAGVLAENGVSESTTTATSSSTSTSTTSSSTSPHQTKAKHTKVVVKKHHKTARKARIALVQGGDTTADSVASARSLLAASSSSSAASPSVVSTSNVPAQVAALESQSATVAFDAGTIQQWPLTTAGAASDGRAHHSSASKIVSLTEVASENGAESGTSNDSAGNAQPGLTLEEIDPMAELTDVSYEPVLSDESAELPKPLFGSVNEDFDEALAQVAASAGRRSGRRPVGTPAGPSQSGQSPTPEGLKALVGMGAIVAAGYRLVFRTPDDPKRQPSWYARFPAG